MSADIIIYPAKRVITMDPENPEATAVAVKDGRILGIGDADNLMHCIKNSVFGAAEIDTQFQNKILMPGLVDAHTHPSSLALEYANHFVAQVPWNKPEGGFFPTYGTKKEVLARLKELDAILPKGQILWATHYDDNQAGGFLYRKDLDEVSMFHRFWINSAVFKQAGVSLEPNAPRLTGVELDENNIPDGNLIESTGMSHFISVLGACFVTTEESMKKIIPLFTGQGMTTVAESAFGGFSPKGIDADVSLFQKVFADGKAGFRIGAMPFYHTLKRGLGNFDAVWEKIQSLAQPKESHFQLCGVKLYLDGSIIAHTAPLGWPGYWDGFSGQHNENSPEDVREAIIRFHKLGVQTFTHTNSALASQVVIDAVEEAQSMCSRPDIRHRMEHCYGITSAQLRRCKVLGIAVQFFSSQIYYYGDNHLTVQGPDRGGYRLLPAKTADRLGVSWGMHVDPPGAPQLPWIAMWAAVQRKTLQGQQLGTGQCVSVESVLRAFTLEHAWQLRMDDEVGSIEFGKKADFCVLEADPLTIAPDELKDIPVWGTVFEGTPHKGFSKSKIEFSQTF